MVKNDDRADWTEVFRIAPGDVLYCWHADIFTSTVQKSIEDAGYEIRAQIIWSKDCAPMSRGHYRWKHEPCWYAVKKGANAGWIGGHSQCTVWDISLDETAEGGHGTQKPIDCMANPIRNHSGDVYEPFSGSGTTIVACEQLGRSGFGMEIDPNYIAVILERFSKLGIQPELIDG